MIDTLCVLCDDSRVIEPIVLVSDQNPTAASIELCDGVLARSDFSHQILTGAVIRGARIEDVGFARADLTGCVFHGVSFRSVRFTNAILRRVVFIDCEFVMCDFSDVTLQHATLERCQLVGCCFLDADMRGVSLMQTRLLDCNIRGWVIDEHTIIPQRAIRKCHTGRTRGRKSITHMEMIYEPPNPRDHTRGIGPIERVEPPDSRIVPKPPLPFAPVDPPTQADIDQFAPMQECFEASPPPPAPLAWLHELQSREALETSAFAPVDPPAQSDSAFVPPPPASPAHQPQSFPNANLSERELSGWICRGWVLTGASFHGATILDCDFRDADLTTAIFSQATIERCDFKNADLSSIQASGAVFVRCDFRGARLSKAFLRKAKFIECDMRVCNISDITTWGIRFCGCDIRGWVQTYRTPLPARSLVGCITGRTRGRPRNSAPDELVIQPGIDLRSPVRPRRW